MIVGSYRAIAGGAKRKNSTPIAQNQCAAKIPVGPQLPVQKPEGLLQLLLRLAQPQPLWSPLFFLQMLKERYKSRLYSLPYLSPDIVTHWPNITRHPLGRKSAKGACPTHRAQKVRGEWKQRGK